jgi:hypothetical protein
MTGVSVSEESQKVLNGGVSASDEEVEHAEQWCFSIVMKKVKRAEQWCFSIVKKMMKGCCRWCFSNGKRKGETIAGRSCFVNDGG